MIFTAGLSADDVRRLEWVPAELLVRFMEQEHIQMQALTPGFFTCRASQHYSEFIPGAKTRRYFVPYCQYAGSQRTRD